MIKKKADLIQLVLWAIVALATLIFIFSNSFRDGPESMKQSSVVVEVVESVVDPGHKIEEGLLHTIVRKSAHFTEFFVLGLSLRMMFIFVSKLTKKNFYILPFFICLLSAVTDEFIQSFTGRTSAILDVLIDFSGSALAILLVMVGMLIVHLIKSKKIEIEQKEEDASN